MAAWRPLGLDPVFFEEEEDKGGPEDLLLEDSDLDEACRDDGRSLFSSWLSERSLFLLVPDGNKCQAQMRHKTKSSYNSLPLLFITDWCVKSTRCSINSHTRIHVIHSRNIKSSVSIIQIAVSAAVADLLSVLTAGPVRTLACSMFPQSQTMNK